MSIIDWIFVIGIALAIVAFLACIFYLLRFFRIKQQLQQLPIKRKKSKKQQRIIERKKFFLTRKKKKSLKLSLLMFLLTGVFFGSAAYFSYYQTMNLTTDDSDSIVKCYYLLQDFESQLILSKEQADEEETLQKNIRYLATSMASYGTKTASEINSQEGQLTLNRYYNAVKQIGMNASNQMKNFYGNSQVVDSFLEDIKKAQVHEQAAFDYYKVDESAFLEEK